MTRKTEGGKGDRIPGADQAAYEVGYGSINWNAREEFAVRESRMTEVHSAEVHSDVGPDGRVAEVHSDPTAEVHIAEVHSSTEVHS